MSVAVGDVITMTVTKVAGYACWGMFKGQTGFVHCVEWSREKPVPDSRVPCVGGQMKVKVFKIVTEPQSQLPADVTFGGSVTVDFAASVALLEDALV
jgi:predicted RNA-binding protein with RPS1 domain